jgi:hypothetical protein
VSQTKIGDSLAGPRVTVEKAEGGDKKDCQPQDVGRRQGPKAKNTGPELSQSQTRDAFKYAQRVLQIISPGSFVENLIRLAAAEAVEAAASLAESVAEPRVPGASEAKREAKRNGRPSGSIVPAKPSYVRDSFAGKLLVIHIWRRFLLKLAQAEHPSRRKATATRTRVIHDHIRHAKKKRSKAYKHFILNTIIKSISNAIYVGLDKGARINDLRDSVSQTNLLRERSKGAKGVIDSENLARAAGSVTRRRSLLAQRGAAPLEGTFS